MKEIMAFFILSVILNFTAATVLNLQSAPKQPKHKCVNYSLWTFCFVFADTDGDGHYDYLVVFKDNDLVFETPFVVINPLPNDTTFIQEASRIENLTIEQCMPPSSRYSLYFDAYAGDSTFIGTLISNCNQDTAYFFRSTSPIISSISGNIKFEGKTMIWQKSKGDYWEVPTIDGIETTDIKITNSIGQILSVKAQIIHRENNVIYLDIKEFPTGIYYLTILNQRNKLFYKLLIY